MAASTMAALTSLGDTIDDQAEGVPETKAEKLAVFDEAMVFLRAGIGVLQDR